MRFFIIACFLIFGCTACTTLNPKLQQQELRIFPQKVVLKHKLVFENDQAFLYFKAPLKNYQLDLRAYSGNELNSMSWEQVYAFKDTVLNQIHKVKLNAPSAVFSLEIRLLKLNNQVLFHDLHYADKYQHLEEVLYCKTAEGYPVFDNYLMSNQVFHIRHNKDSIANFCIKYYGDAMRPAPPPYSRNTGLFNPLRRTSDRVFQIKRTQDLKLTEKGLYYIQLDTFGAKGICLSYFGEDYPKMTRVGELILATRYITKNEEYLRMKNAENPKAALDAYWLARNKTKNNAKDLIRTYYNRMQTANERFSSSKEGWKTDKGIIYTIFGSPTIVRKYKDREVWYYSHQPGRYPIEYVFLKIGQQYILERSGNLREAWNAEVSRWRTGNID